MSIVAKVSSGDNTNDREGVIATPILPIPAHAGALRIGFWGTQSLFSQQVLTTLLAHYPVTVVALPARTTTAPAVTQWQPPPVTPIVDELLLVNSYVAPDTAQIAWQQQIPTYQVQRLRAAAVAEWLAMAALDLVCVACFPWRIPAALLGLPRYGFLNLHPSLLPAYRGPAPLFWQLRDGLDTIGITVHWMDAAFDAGPIAAQSPLPLPDGATSAELDRLCATTGATLLLDLLHQLEQGGQPRQPQPTGGSQQAWPATDDFRLDVRWSARHAYNFICGADEWHQPYPIRIGNDDLMLRRALAFTPDQALAQPLARSGAEVMIQFTPGVLRALLW